MGHIFFYGIVNLVIGFHEQPKGVGNNLSPSPNAPWDQIHRVRLTDMVLCVFSVLRNWCFAYLFAYPALANFVHAVQN